MRGHPFCVRANGSIQPFLGSFFSGRKCRKPSWFLQAMVLQETACRERWFRCKECFGNPEGVVQGGWFPTALYGTLRNPTKFFLGSQPWYLSQMEFPQMLARAFFRRSSVPDSRPRVGGPREEGALDQRSRSTPFGEKKKRKPFRGAEFFVPQPLAWVTYIPLKVKGAPVRWVRIWVMFLPFGYGSKLSHLGPKV